MAAACQNCSGMGTIDGKDCPVCVGGKKSEAERALVTPETVLPVGRVEDLPPSTATPDGTVPAATSNQGAITPPVATKVPGTVEVEEGTPLGPPSNREDVSIDDVPVSHGGTAPEGGVAPEEDEPEEDVPYEEQNVVDLQAELRDRGLPVSGNKEELIERLEEDDEARADANA